MLIPIYRKEKYYEICFLIDLGRDCPDSQLANLKNELIPFFRYLPTDQIYFDTALNNPGIVGPRLAIETPSSTSAVQILRSTGFPEAQRVEEFRLYSIPSGQDRKSYLAKFHDPVTECQYDELPKSFRFDYTIPAVEEIPLLEKGESVLRRFIINAGLKFNELQIEHIIQISKLIGKNPTNVTLSQYSQMWSDHCRHILFMLTRLIIDGKLLEKTLFQLLREPFDNIMMNKNNISIGFHDNGSAIIGYRVPILRPEKPGTASPYMLDYAIYHITWSGETHNYPGHVSPYPGAATEVGGEIRDQLGIGRGSDILFAGCGRVVGSLIFPNGYKIPGEIISGRWYSYPLDKAEPIKVTIDGLQGWQDYANCFGKPNPMGFFYSGAVWRPRRKDNQIIFERIESLKPVCFGSGYGTVREEHLDKRKATKDMVMVQIGGPAFRIGFGGGSGSSNISGSNSTSFDENAVQRGDAVMERLFYQVILDCIAMGVNNPIEIDHDQGAGGISNVLTELAEKTGASIYIGAVHRGDQTMSDLEVWICEYQERQGLVIRKENLYILEQICARENCPLEILGEITEDRILQVFSEKNGIEVGKKSAEPIVKFPLDAALSKLPMVDLSDETPEDIRFPIQIPKSLTFKKALVNILRRTEVGSKEWIIRGVDGSIGALTIQNQYCGPFVTPVTDCAISALSRLDYTKGFAASIGLAPYLTALDPACGARMAVGEMITNLMGVKADFNHIQCIGNWMWPANITPSDGEVARLVQAVKALNQLLISLGIAIIGGKDSSSMATVVDNKLVKSIETVVISGTVDLADTKLYITPEIKEPGDSVLLLIDLANGKKRLGGSSFGQTLGQLGADCPDLEDPEKLIFAYQTVTSLIKEEATAGHDISSGGLITTVLEMCFAAGCGIDIWLKSKESIFNELFAEELGYIIECSEELASKVIKIFSKGGIRCVNLGRTKTDPNITIRYNGELILNESIWDLKREWERTGYQLRRLRVNSECADKEWRNTATCRKPNYVLTFEPKKTLPEIILRKNKPKIAVIREQGINGHPEMIDAWYKVGFDAWDVHMSDLESGNIKDFQSFRGLIFPGGFSYGDVLGAAVGWGLKIKRDPKLREIFEQFFAREDTFSLGICNGAQLGLFCGWAPYPDIPEEKRPRFTQIPLGHFNHDWIRLKIQKSPAMMLQGMEGSILGAWVANGEGYFNSDHAPEIYQRVINEGLVPLVYVDPLGRRTKALPHSPSGSFIAGVCDPSGRHLYMMPHTFDRGSILETWGYVPPKWEGLEASPWLRMGQNAYDWVNQ